MVQIWAVISGFDRTNNLDFDEHGNSPIEFTNVLSDGASKADIHICDPQSALSFQNGMEVIVWDETAPAEAGGVPATPAHNLLRKAVVLSDTTNWIVTNTNGLTVNTGALTSFSVTYSNTTTSGIAGLRQYCAAGYIFPGQQYMLSAYVSGSGISNVQYALTIIWLDAGYNTISQIQQIAAVPGTQTRFNLSGVAPANAFTCICAIYTQSSSSTNAGTVTIGTPQLEPMYFTAQGVSYPTPDCNFNQTDCSRMPDDTISRQVRLFSGYIDDIHVAYDGPNRIWTLSCAAASALLENDALINYSVVNTFDNTIISNLISAFYPLSIYTGSGSNYNTSSINDVPVNSFAPQPLIQGIEVGTQTWADASMRDVMNALADASGYVYWLDPHYTLYYQPSYYNAASFQVVAATSADGITKIAPQDYSIEYDAMQRKRSVKVIGEPANAPTIAQPFNTNGVQTKFYLAQIPQTVTSVVVGGVTKVAGIAGVNTFGQNLGGGNIVALISQAGDSTSQVPTPYIIFQVAPANGAGMTVTYTYNAPVVVQVLDQSQVNNVVAPPYAVPNFWTRVHDTSIADTTTAITRGLAELTKRSQVITKITFKTFQFVAPGTSIFFTSALDNINNQSFVARSVTGRLLGPGIHQYEVEMSDHPLPDSATTMLRHVHKAHQRSTATASVTTPQQTDIVFSEFAAYSESITYTQPFLVYGSSVASAIITTAGKMAEAGGGTETTKTTTTVSTSAGYMELYALGKTGASVNASLPAFGTGNGWIDEGTTFDNKTIPAGTWTDVIALSDATAGPYGVSSIVTRFGKVNGGVYTLFGTATLSNQAINTTRTIYTPSASLGAKSMVPGDKLYIERFVQKLVGIVLDATSNGTTSTGSSISWSHTVGGGNRILIVALSYPAGRTVSNITYNGVAMTLLSSIQTGGGGGSNLAFYYLLAPATGTNTVSVTVNVGPVSGCSVSYSGVAQSSTFGTTATNSGAAGANPSNTVTTTSPSQVVVDMAGNDLGVSLTPASSQTSRSSAGSSGASEEEAIADIAATGSNMSLSWTQGSSANWAEISVAMNGVPPSFSGDVLTVYESNSGTAGVGNDEETGFPTPQ